MNGYFAEMMEFQNPVWYNGEKYKRGGVQDEKGKTGFNSFGGNNCHEFYGICRTMAVRFNWMVVSE